MVSYRNIRTFALVLIVAATSARETHAQRFHGGSFGGHALGGRSFAGHSFAVRTPSVGYGARSVRPANAISGFRTGYRIAPYQTFGYGFNRRHRDFRYGHGYPSGFGYPWYGYGYSPYGYGYPGDSDYGTPYSGYLGYGGLLPGSIAATGSQDTGAALDTANQVQNSTVNANMDALLQAAGAAAFMGRIQWPLGLEILPGADSLRERIEGLFTTAAAQAVAGKVNPQLPAQIKKAVKEFQQLVAWDKHERLTLSSAMYEDAEAFLRQLAQSSGRLSALEFARASNRDASLPPTPGKGGANVFKR